MTDQEFQERVLAWIEHSQNWMERTEEWKTRTDNRLDSLEDRMDNFEGRMDRFEERMGSAFRKVSLGFVAKWRERKSRVLHFGAKSLS